MSTEEILTHFPEYRKGLDLICIFFISFGLFMIFVEFEEKGRLPERILKTIERRIAKGEGHDLFLNFFHLTHIFIFIQLLIII